MKKLLTLFFLASLISCKNSAKTDRVEFECTGACPDNEVCYMEGGSGKNYLDCGCNDCFMLITVIKNDKPIKQKVKSIEIPILEGFNSYHQKLHPKKEIVISKIIKEIHPKGESYLLEYLIDSNKNTVMYAISGGKTYKVDCSGTCDCRERFYYEQGYAECTCEDCTLTYSEVQSNGVDIKK